jgi:4-amino-4-deoxy-L-arabinose transferase-like glycosyltransferase
MSVAEVTGSGQRSLARLGNPAVQRWLTTIAAALVLVVAGIIRLLDVNHHGFNADEAVYAGQTAALAGHQDFAELFGVFRAHPLLVQFVTSVLFRMTGVNDVAPRFLAVGAGLALVVVTGLLAGAVRGKVAGIIAMTLVAISAYPITVSRQFLLDGPEALFVALSLLFLVLYLKKPIRLSLYAAAIAAGLAFLCKETAILLIPAIIVFFVTVPGIKVKFRDGVAFVAVYLVTISPFPLSLLLGGGTKVAQQFLVWQLFRRPNHDASFYLTSLESVGMPLLLLAGLGAAVAIWRHRPIDVLMVLTIVVIGGFYELWPVKGYQYLLPLIAPVAVLAAEGALAVGKVVSRIASGRGEMRWRWSEADATIALFLLVALVAASGIPALNAHQPVTINAAAASGDAASAKVADASDETDLSSSSSVFLAGSGGLEGGRPAGQWIAAHTLPGSRFLTIGPSFANVIAFYGLRHARGLSVSANPLRRNPTYDPTDNPDLLIRTGAVQYIVFDAYSANRTPVFAKKLVSLVKKYNGVKVYSGYPEGTSTAGGAHKPVVVVYEVHR